MASVGEKFRPGTTVPDSGLYRCDASCNHQWSTDAKGHFFPALPAYCAGSHWILAWKTSQ
jgi:hypothetical protein